MGSPVISLRDGLDREAIWVVELGATAGESGVAINWTPVDPSLPQIDLYEAAEDGEEEAT